MPEGGFRILQLIAIWWTADCGHLSLQQYVYNDGDVKAHLCAACGRDVPNTHLVSFNTEMDLRGALDFAELNSFFNDTFEPLYSDTEL